MCGIAGIWQLDDRKVEHDTIRRFIGALAHRGPDGEGVLLDDHDRLALAHRRLAILDLSRAADQPMVSLHGRYVITYNGEIYNFLELRAELEKKGCRFRSQSDTEVILAAFEQWGTDCLPRFNGMWSFAIWDRLQRSLFLSRDRFGVKPLYVALDARRLAFASELKAFLHLDGFAPVANETAVRARLDGNGSDHNLLCGVESLPPGQCLEVTPERTRRWQWWNTLDHLVRVPQNPADQAEEFRELLLDSCRLRVRSDVPAAVSLSGGLDSSSVLCSLAAAQDARGTEREAPQWRRAYIASFPGTLQDETMYAMLAAERAAAVPVIHQLSGAEISGQLDSYLYQYEEIGGLSGIASWLLYGKMHRDNVIVSLEGHGGDELLGGYGLHILLALLRGPSFITAPRRTLDLINTLQHMYSAQHPERPGSKVRLATLTIPPVRAVARRLLRGQRVLNETLRRHSFDPSAADEIAPGKQEAIEALGPLTGALYHSFHSQSLPRILRNFDALSMGHGIEVRTPLLDWRLVCYGFSVPDESKAGGGYAKRLLREAMRGVLPEKVRLRRDKLGYNAPVADWLQGGLSDWLWDQVNDAEFLRSDLWDGRALLTLARAKRESGAPWLPGEMRRATMAVTAHWWRTRWLKTSRRNEHKKQT